jgi:general secretion pathway protein H
LWRPPAAGFTLVEMLVVVVIIAIMITGAVLALSVAGRDRALENEARRLEALLNLARERAELQTREYGLRAGPASYAFVIYEPRSGEWIFPPDESLRARELPEGLALRLVVEGRPIVLRDQDGPTGLLPQIGIASSGGFSSFELTLEREGGETLTLRTAEDGGLAPLQTAESAG